MAWVPQYNREATERAALRSSYGNAAQQAGAQALGAARTLGRGNPLAAARAGANAAASASSQMLGREAAASTQLAMQQQARLAQEAEERRTRTERMMGGILGAAGQAATMMIPGLSGMAGAISPGGFVPGQGITTWQSGGAGRMPLGERQASFGSFDAFRGVQRASPGIPGGASRTLGMVDQAMGGAPQMTEEEMRRRLLGGGM